MFPPRSLCLSHLTHLPITEHPVKDLKVALLLPVKDGEPDLAEPSPTELWILEHLGPAVGNLPRRVVERAAPDGSEDEQLVALARGDAQAEAHLVLGQLPVRLSLKHELLLHFA